MVPNHMSSLVFVGGEFTPALFDERRLFAGRLDPNDQLKVGPMAVFGYSEGKFRFEIVPDRIDLKCNAPELMPGDLVDAARSVATMLEPTRRLARVSGFGMNCNTVFEKEQIGMTGAEFCLQLVNSRIEELVESSSISVCERVRFGSDVLLFDIRIEPHFNSNGNDLFVAVNGHQAVNQNEPLVSKLDRIGAFEEYVSAFHDRIMATNPALVQH